MNFYQRIEKIAEKDRRYKTDAYEFVMQALCFTQKKLKREGHVSAKELLEGVREYALEQYGPMARTVLVHWGIGSTADFGEIVFNMIDSDLMRKTESDSKSDFKDVYNFKDAFNINIQLKPDKIK